MNSMHNNSYDIVIIGGGIAGLTAGMYSCRAGLKTLLIERLMPGGQIINADKVEDFPGFPDGIFGAELGPQVQEQATRYGLEIQLDEVKDVQPEKDTRWRINAHDGEYLSKTVIIAGGSTLRKLGIPGEEGLFGAGVSYCASCDGSFFTDQVVGVVGGGDSALDEALVLTEYASHVILFHRGNKFSGKKVLQDRVSIHDKIEARWNTTVDAILGETKVEGLSITNAISGRSSRIDLSGVFIFVGLKPNSEYLKDLLPLDNAGHIPTDIWMRTAVDGLFAAGDIRQSSAAQLVSAAGDGATAAIAAYRYIEKRQRQSQLE